MKNDVASQEWPQVVKEPILIVNEATCSRTKALEMSGNHMWWCCS